MAVLSNLMNWNFICRDSDGSVYLFEDDPRLCTDGTTWLAPSNTRSMFVDDSGIVNRPEKEFIGVSK